LPSWADIVIRLCLTASSSSLVRTFKDVHSELQMLQLLNELICLESISKRIIIGNYRFRSATWN